MRTGRQYVLSDDVVNLPPCLYNIRWLAVPPSLHEYRFAPARGSFCHPQPDKLTLNLSSELQAPHHDLPIENDSCLVT